MESLIRQDGELLIEPAYLPPDRAEEYFSIFFKEIAWGREVIRIHGRDVAVPRMVCWYGDPDAVYLYSGVKHHPRAWLPALSRLRRQLSELLQYPFNSVLANLYRDGQDSMGWHADDEPELGRDPCIASLSLGASRRFRIQHKKSKQAFSYDLPCGSLLVMRGAFQHHWRHCVPKTARAVEARINLTFRYVLC